MRAEIVKRSWTLVALALALLLSVGCGKSTTDPDDDPDPVKLTLAGWKAFESLAWNSALDNFNNAISAGATSSEAYSGAGWANLKLDNPTTARERWTTGLTKTGATNDIYYGLGSLDMQEEQFTSAIGHYETVLESSPTYVFIHAVGVDYQDLYLGLAGCFYEIGEFENSLAYVQMLNPRFVADLTTEEGLAELSQEIERLNSIIG